MSAYVLTRMLCCVISAILSAAIIARDSRLRVNWLLGSFPAAAAWWAFCELVWNTRTMPESAVVFVRLSAIGWVMLGPVCLHVFVELLGAAGRALGRLVPWAYACSAVAIGLYTLTPWCVSGMHEVPWGWEPSFGPLFLPVYSASAWPALVVIANWPSLYPRHGSLGEKRVAIAALASIAIVVVGASVSEVLLPQLGYELPRQGSLSLTAVSVMVAFYLHRYGYSLLAPGAFAQEILGALHDGVALLLPNGVLRSANPALHELVGVADGRLAGIELRQLLPDLPEEEHLPIGSSIETELHTPAGERVPVSVTLCRLPLIMDSTGSRLGKALTVSDMREVAALRSRLLTTARLAAVGELSAGISHEISRPVSEVREHLAALLGHWVELHSEVARGDDEVLLSDIFAEGEDLIGECMEGADRVAAILKDVRGFSQGESAPRAPSQINRLVAGAMRIVDGQRPPGVEIVTALGDLPDVACGASEIEQVLINLIVNAMQAIGDQGKVTISTEAGEGEVLIRVADDGCGIPDEIRERIFDPFFTTKPVGQGTGLGLAICHRIVRSHGGDIEFESRPGAGTTLTIRLPVDSAAAL